MAVPNTFAAATSAIPLANLDANFAYYDAAYSITSTAISFTGAVTLSTGTANGVPYLNASKVLTSGSVLTFDGTILSSTRFAGALNGTVGATTANTGAFTTLTTSSTVTLNGGTANGVAYLDGSKVLTTGTALVFDGTNLALGTTINAQRKVNILSSAGQSPLVAVGPNGYLLVDNAGAGENYFQANSANYFQANSANVWQGSGGSEQMRLTSTGLGIGTSNPAYKLDVNGSANINGDITLVSNAGIFFSGAGNYNAGVFGRTGGTEVAVNVGAGAEIARFTSTGLGIGTSLPGYKLDVAGTIRATVVSSGNYAIYNAPTNGGYATYQASGADIAYVGSALPVFGAGASTDFAITATSGKSLFLGSNAVKQATLDSSGNLGLGGTPSAWTTFRALQVGAGASVFGHQLTAAEAYLTSNMYYNAGSKFIGSGYAALYGQSAGAHSWSTSTASGTAGTAITFTQAMTLDASGNLLVGTTSFTSSDSNSILFGTIYGAGYWQHASGTASGATYHQFNYAGNVIGSITQTGTTGVLYNVTSDYRLKDINGPVTTSGAFIDSLKPVQGSWKADGSRFIGFLAHELQEVSETVVGTGVKDGEEMQSIDYSNAELIANLVAELQSLRKRLAAAGI